MNHPHKVSRKKLMAENKSLKGQVITGALMNSAMASVYAIQTALIIANKNSKEETGTRVFTNGGIVPNKDDTLNNVC